MEDQITKYPKRTATYKYTWSRKFFIIRWVYLRRKYPTYQSPYAAGRSESRMYGINYVNTAKRVLVPVEVKNNTHIFVYCYLWNGTTNSGKLFCYRIIGGLVLLMT